MESTKGILDTSKLKFNGDFMEQVTELIEYIQLQNDDMDAITEILQDIYDSLSANWTNIEIFSFGSVASGLAMKTSDVDCYVALPSWMHPPSVSFVTEAQQVLRQRRHLFRNVFAITHARVPIVQMYHIPTNTECDVSFHSALGVKNSQLIASLMKLDNRVFELTLLIKYWSKIHNLTGQNLMSNYCLTLLVIFFLQQSNLLQAVMEMQKDIPKNLVDDWNTAFKVTPLDHINGRTLYELLGDFLRYYKTFEYDKYIISPYVGHPISRELFANTESVPFEFSLYKTNVETKNLSALRLDGSMCVQDPFEHNRNCAVAVYPKLAQRFLAKLQEAIALYEICPSSDFLKKFLEVKPGSDGPGRKKRGGVPQRGIHKRSPRGRSLRHFRWNDNNFRQNSNTFRRTDNNFRQNSNTFRRTDNNFRQNSNTFRRIDNNFRQNSNNFRQNYIRGRKQNR